MKSLVLVLIVAAVAVKVINGQDAPASPPSGESWKHWVCSAECAYKCHASLRHFPVLCMTKCVAECLGSSPSEALLGCTYNCASLEVADNEKQLQSIEGLQQVGHNVVYCYDKCNNNKAS